MSKTAIKFWALLLLSLLLCVQSSICLASPTKVSGLVTYKSIRTEHWQTISNNTNLLEAKLLLLQTELLKLNNQTQELKTTLINLMAELSNTKMALQDARVSLSNVEDSLKKIEQSYKELESNVEAERKEALKRERNAYRKGWLNGFCVGLGTGVIIAVK